MFPPVLSSFSPFFLRFEFSHSKKHPDHTEMIQWLNVVPDPCPRSLQKSLSSVPCIPLPHSNLKISLTQTHGYLYCLSNEVQMTLVSIQTALEFTWACISGLKASFTQTILFCFLHLLQFGIIAFLFFLNWIISTFTFLFLCISFPSIYVAGVWTDNGLHHLLTLQEVFTSFQ